MLPLAPILAAQLNKRIVGDDMSLREPSLSQPPGLIVLFGSGETSARGRVVWDWLLRQLPQPVRVSILETPAGFQPNSALVAGKVKGFLLDRLQNHRPEVTIIPARKRDTPYSPDDPAVVEPMLHSDVIFLGPGSPTYTVRQLRDSLAWHTLVARHRMGMAVVMASAATIAAGAQALPVYEIYKSGDDLHWCPGLDFLGPYGLSPIFVSHWDNSEGGAELDTSYCFMGQERFANLRELLPTPATVVGIDEHTALILDLGRKDCKVMGKGGVTIQRDEGEQTHEAGSSFSITELGPFSMVDTANGLATDVWERVVVTSNGPRAASPPRVHQVPLEVLDLVQKRESARTSRDWSQSDALRAEIRNQGWELRDTPQGPELLPAPQPR